LSHGQHITYSTGDFNQAKNIYEQGKIAVKEELSKLDKLSKRLKMFKHRERRFSVVTDSIIINNIVYNGISKSNLNLVKARSNLKTGVPYTKHSVVKGINNAMGTAIFNQIEYNLINNNDETELIFNASETASHQIKGAINYNNDIGAGVILNYTGRNLIGNSSRSLVTLEITKNPKIRVQHQNIISENKKWWMRTELYASNYQQGLFTSGFRVDDLKYNFVQVSSQFNRNLSSLKSYLGLKIEYDNTLIRPQVPPEISDEALAFKKYRAQNYAASIKYEYNTINSPFFATKGSLLIMQYKRSFKNNLKFELFGLDEDEDEDSNINGMFPNQNKFVITAKNRLPISQKLTVASGITSGFIFEDKLKNDELSFVDYGIGYYFLGGNTTLFRSDSFLFPGLKHGEASASQFIEADVSLQYAFDKKFYVTPHLDVLIFGQDSFSNYLDNLTKPTGNWTNPNLEQTALIISSGITLSYNSILGPINIDTSFVNGIGKIRFFVGVGYSFVGL